MEIIVFGMHRSGTSLVCSILNKMGVYFGESAMLMRDQSNEKGYFERFQVNEVQDYILRVSGFSWVKISGYDVDCLGKGSQQIFDGGLRSLFNECREKAIWGVKDPRTCLTFPLWKKHLKQPVCIFAFRNPCHVAASLNKRDGFPVDFGLALWEKYNVLGLNNIRGLPTIFMDFDSLTREPDLAVNKLYAGLTELGAEGITMLDESEVGSLVDRKLVHHREENKGNDCGMTSSQAGLYEGLKKGLITKENSSILLSSKTARVLKEYEDVIVHGTKEDVVNKKLVDMIDGERRLVLNVGPASSKFEVSLKGKLPNSKIINVRLSASLKDDDQDAGAFLFRDQENVMDYITSSIGEGSPDLLILNRVMFKLESPVKILARLRELLASNAQILVLDKNPRNIVAMNKLLGHGIWQSATGSTFDFEDKQVLTMQELIRVFTVCGCQVVSSDYNIDPRLENLYRQGLQQKNRPDLHLDRFTLKRVTRSELRELCSNWMFLNLSNA